MGNYIVDYYDDSRTVYFFASRQRHTIFPGSVSLQRWVQRILQRLAIIAYIGDELNLKSVNSYGAGNRLGNRSDNNRRNLHLGIKLAPNLPLYCHPANNPNLLRALVHKIIPPLPGRKAQILLSLASNPINRPNKLQPHAAVRHEIITRLPLKDLRLHQDHGRRVAINDPAAPLLRLAIQIQLHQDPCDLRGLYLVGNQSELLHLD